MFKIEKDLYNKIKLSVASNRDKIIGTDRIVFRGCGCQGTCRNTCGESCYQK